MSFFKKFGFTSNALEQKPTSQSNPSTMQSMYNLEQKKEVIPEKSYEAESIKPGKPPASKPPGKSSMFSNMKVKKSAQEEKKQESTMVTNAADNTYIPPTILQSKVETYQPPQIPKKQQSPTPIPSFFKQKQSSEVQSSDRESASVSVQLHNHPIKRKNSSNSAAELEPPTKQSPSKKSVNIAPSRSTNNMTRTTSRSSLEKKEEIPVRRKSEAKFDEVKEIQNQMLRAKERIVEKMRIQKEIKNRIMDETESLTMLKQRQNEAIQNQNVAVEAQQYEKAAELEEQLSELKQEISVAEAQLVKLERQFTEAEQNICAQYIREQQQKAIFKKRLLRAKVEAEKIYDVVMKTQSEKIELQRGKMQRDRKKLSSLKAEISFNVEKIKECEHQYEEDLNNQTQLFKEQKDDLSRRKLQIADDIRDLQNRLQQKRQELVIVDGELELADSSIDQVKRGFQNQYRKIVQRKDKLYEMEIERDEFSLGLDQLEKLTQDQVKSLDSTLNQMKQNISFITQQSEQYDSSGGFRQRLQVRRKTFGQFLKETAKVKQFQNEMKGKQDRVKEIEFKKSSLALQISLLDSKKKQLKDKIPQLESEKIALVSGKNFKGAQSKSTEIKQANDQLVLLSSQIQAKYQQQKKIDKQYTDAQEQLDTQKQTQDQLKKDLAKSQFELQILRFRDLNNEKLALSKYTSPQKQELLTFVNSQIQELKQELEFLRTEYGLQKEEDESPAKEDQKLEQGQDQYSKVEEKPSKDEQPSVEYQAFNEEQENSRYGYVSASPLQEKNQEPTEQSQLQLKDTQEKEEEDKPTEQEHNQSEAENIANNNQKSEQQSIEQVRNEGYQPATF